jgi:peptidoglycan/xylan/chitin deacetylase (PgdA/CDA1 family)
MVQWNKMTGFVDKAKRKWTRAMVLRRPVGFGPAGEDRIGLVVYFDHEAEFGNASGKEAGQEGFESIADILKTRAMRTTWNCVGLVGLRYPRTIERLMTDGHEIACHSYAHIRPSEVAKRDLESDVAKAKALFKEKFGVDLKGFHSPADAWSRTLIDCLLRQGFEYDIAYEKPGPNRDISLLSKWRYGFERELPSILRIPTAGDDWSFISKDRTPEEIREDWNTVLHPDNKGKTIALGFHPWVLGMHDSWIGLFRDFIDAVNRADHVRVLTGTEVAEWVGGKRARGPDTR